MERVYQFMPEARDKKIILYAPTFRGRVSRAKAPDMIDFERFAKELSDDYVLISKHHPFCQKLPEIPEPCPLAFDLLHGGQQPQPADRLSHSVRIGHPHAQRIP